jgi:hypothetical protein
MIVMAALPPTDPRHDAGDAPGAADRRHRAATALTLAVVVAVVVALLVILL